MRYDSELLNTLTPENVLVYLRKSRSDDPNLTVEEVLIKHEAMLDEWAEQYLGARVPECNKLREVVSGETITDRPQMQELLRRIESPRYKAVLIKESSRLSRGDLMDAGLVIRTFRYTGTAVLTPQRIYNVEDDFDRKFFEQELKSGNEFLEYQKRIQHDGKMLSISHGNYIGSIPPYGYDKDTVYDGKRKCPTLKINEEQAPAVRMIFEMYALQGIGPVNIAHRLDELGFKPPHGEHWSPTSIRSILTNIHYTGRVRWNKNKTISTVSDGEIVKKRPRSKADKWLVYDGRHPAIVTDELFHAAGERMGSITRAPASRELRNPLAGLIYCHCGRAMVMRTYKTPAGDERSAPRLLCDGQTHCGTGSCLYSEMLPRVHAILEQSIADFEVKLRSNQESTAQLHAQQIKFLEKKKSALDAKELALWDAQADPDIEKRMPLHIFKQLIEKLKQERAENDAALRNARFSTPAATDYANAIERFKTALNALDDPTASAAQQNLLLKNCIERITYSREKPQRIKNPTKRSRKNPGYTKPVLLPVGGSWTTPPIEIEVSLKV